MTNGKERLFSLDALRGLDMLFLCVVQPLVVAAANGWGFADPAKHPFMRQFAHYWGGFTAYDLIMPLFIFMCGAAVPFALPKRLDDRGHPTPAFWKHIAWRVVMLWVIGMASQGNLLTFDWRKFAYFSNTLQSIAVGYVIAALVLLIRSPRIRLAVPFVLAGIYGLSLHFGGDYSVSGNFAMKVDVAFVRVLQPVLGHDSGYYSWYWTSLMFGAMTLCGMLSAQTLLSARSPWRKVAWLAGSGAAVWLSGLILEKLGVPCIKHIFTVSFTAQAMGICVLLLAALYVVNDIWRFRRGWWVVTLYGQTALASYVLGEMFRSIPTAVSEALLGGLATRIGGPWGMFVVQIGTVFALTFFLGVWRRASKGVDFGRQQQADAIEKNVNGFGKMV